MRKYKQVKEKKVTYSLEEWVIIKYRAAKLAMKVVYEQFSGYKFDEPPPKSGKGKVKAIHYIQSFDPKDNILP